MVDSCLPLWLLRHIHMLTYRLHIEKSASTKFKVKITCTFSAALGGTTPREELQP